MRRVIAVLGFAVALSGCINSEPPEIVFHSMFCDSADLERLMREGEDPNDRSSGRSPVWIVIAISGTESDCLRSLQVLANAGGTIDRTEGGFSALGVALSREVEPGIVSFLGEMGADPCGPINQHVNADSRLFNSGDHPGSLVELAETYSSPEVVAEFKELRMTSNC